MGDAHVANNRQVATVVVKDTTLREYDVRGNPCLNP
jgi:hypothetical protein